MSSSDTNTGDKTIQIFNNLFTKSNVILIVWFLAIYLIVYILLNIFYNTGSGVQNYTSKMAKIIDINKHGIRREIDHQWKPKKKERKHASKKESSQGQKVQISTISN